MRRLPLALLPLALAACAQATPPVETAAASRAPAAASDNVVLRLDSGKLVHGTMHRAATQPPVGSILMLHQAGSNSRGEYGPVVEQFREAGFNLLLLDLRSGADRFDQTNRTAAQYDQEALGYCDAAEDIDLAVDWLARRGGPIFVMGSSYSAALAVRAADLHNDTVAGFVAFSPAGGPPMDGCDPLDHLDAAPRGLVLRPAAEMEHGWIAEQLVGFETAGARTMVVENAVHGASMMVDARTRSDKAQLRETIIGFLRERAARWEAPASR